MPSRSVVVADIWILHLFFASGISIFCIRRIPNRSCYFGTILGNFIAVFELRLTEVDHATAPNISHHIFTGHLDSVSTEQ